MIKQGPNPETLASEVKCPVLIQECEKDEVIGVDSHKKIANLVQGEVNVIKYDIGHFDIYFDDAFEQAVKDQIKFIESL